MTSAIVYKEQWIYEANISGVDIIVGNPFLISMKLVPIPSRRVLMREGDFIALQSHKRSSATSTTSTMQATVSPNFNCTTHGPPGLAQGGIPCSTPEQGGRSLRSPWTTFTLIGQKFNPGNRRQALPPPSLCHLWTWYMTMYWWG